MDRIQLRLLFFHHNSWCKEDDGGLLIDNRRWSISTDKLVGKQQHKRKTKPLICNVPKRMLTGQFSLNVRISFQEA